MDSNLLPSFDGFSNKTYGQYRTGSKFVDSSVIARICKMFAKAIFVKSLACTGC